MQKTAEQTEQLEAVKVCPHCKKPIPEPIRNTLKIKVTWYAKGKNPTKGAKPIKVIRYTEPPTIGTTIQFKDSLYKVVELKEQGAGEAYGFLELKKQGDFKTLKTRIQDKTVFLGNKSKDDKDSDED